MKLDPAGNTLFFRILSGTGSSSSTGIALKSSDNIYLAGSTSANLPVPGSAGQLATSANNYSCCAIAIGSLMAPVTYAGAAPGSALGVVQMNFQIVTGVVSGGFPYPLGLKVIANDGTTSHPASIYVH